MATKWRDSKHKGGDAPELIARRAEFARDLEAAEDAYEAAGGPTYVIRASWWPGRRLRRGWWALVVPELAGVYSQSRRLDQAPAVIAEVIAIAHDWQPGTYRLVIEVVEPDP